MLLEDGRQKQLTNKRTYDDKIRIIYEDNHLLVVEKPVNVLSQGDITGDKDLLTILKEDIKIRYNKPGNVYLGLVHRLDRPVGGVMVFAKTSKAASRLSEQIRNGEFKKEYLAIVHDTPTALKGQLQHNLIKNERRNIVSVVKEPNNNKSSKQALLNYKVLDANEKLSLIHIELVTGRYHQIRVQFSETGNSLYGDQKYGADHNEIGQQIALWSYKIRIKHPVGKYEISFVSNPPDEYPWTSFMKTILRVEKND